MESVSAWMGLCFWTIPVCPATLATLAASTAAILGMTLRLSTVLCSSVCSATQRRTTSSTEQSAGLAPSATVWIVTPFSPAWSVTLATTILTRKPVSSVRWWAVSTVRPLIRTTAQPVIQLWATTIVNQTGTAALSAGTGFMWVLRRAVTTIIPMILTGAPLTAQLRSFSAVPALLLSASSLPQRVSVSWDRIWRTKV